MTVDVLSFDLYFWTCICPASTWESLYGRQHLELVYSRVTVQLNSTYSSQHNFSFKAEIFPSQQYKDMRIVVLVATKVTHGPAKVRLGVKYQMTQFSRILPCSAGTRVTIGRTSVLCTGDGSTAKVISHNHCLDYTCMQLQYLIILHNFTTVIWFLMYWSLYSNFIVILFSLYIRKSNKLSGKSKSCSKYI